MNHEAQTVLRFWFTEITPQQWWKKDSEFDANIKKQFSITHQKAAQGECHTWRNDPQGRLAEIIVLDQFSRNLFRNSAHAYAYDGMALCLAQEAVTAGADQRLEPAQKSFLYMPYMHSESIYIHTLAVKLFQQPGLENNLDFEHRHKAIIERFGRYPHRNAVLGRKSSAEELNFLKQPNAGF